MIRHAKPHEIEEIMTLTKSCAEKMISEGIFQWNEHYPDRNSFENDVERNELYVLIIEDRIAGSITISTFKDQEYDAVDWLTEESAHYYIHRLAIHPDVQHQGWAKQLMDFAEEMAKKQQITSIRLDTFSLNARNQRFYEARGYSRLGSIYFPKQSDAPFYCYELVMV